MMMREMGNEMQQTSMDVEVHKALNPQASCLQSGAL